MPQPNELTLTLHADTDEFVRSMRVATEAVSDLAAALRTIQWPYRALFTLQTFFRGF